MANAAHVHVAGAGNTLKVASPRNVTRLEQVDYGGDVAINAHKVIVVETPVIASNGGQVIRLAGMCLSEVVGLENALLGQLSEGRVFFDFGEVLRGGGG